MYQPSFLLSCCVASVMAVSIHVPFAAADDIVSRIAAYMDAAAEVNQFNGSICVGVSDRTLLKRGYGYANLEHHVANTPATKFRIGSITKQFTAMATMILHEQGKLDVRDLITKHLPDAPEAWSQVTLHHLLTHTSGIPSYTSMAEYGPKMMLPQTTTEMMARFADQPLNFAPGEAFRYSNSGYFLLGVIIEATSGQSYELFLREAVLDPLQLEATGYDDYATVLLDRATGYERRGGELVHAAYLDMSQPFAAGSLYSTVEDLQKWDCALRERKLLSPESYAKMWTAEKDGYAYGWHVEAHEGVHTLSHGGGINGFRSFFLRIPHVELSVAVLCNVQPSNPRQIAESLAAIALGKEVALPRARQVIQVDKQLLKSYEGKYQIRPELVLVVTLDGSKLVAAGQGQPATELHPESETTFFADDVGAQLTFIKNEEGQVVAAVLKQGGREMRAERLD